VRRPFSKFLHSSSDQRLIESEEVINNKTKNTYLPAMHRPAASGERKPGATRQPSSCH